MREPAAGQKAGQAPSSRVRPLTRSASRTRPLPPGEVLRACRSRDAQRLRQALKAFGGLVEGVGHLAFEAKIAELRGSFGEIGDMRLHVMAALTFVDELAETKRRLAVAEEELAAVRGPADDASSAGLETQMADALNKTAERLERLAKTLSVPAPAGAVA